MSALQSLRRVVRGQATPEDIAALGEVLSAIDAGQSLDKAFGVTRARAGRPIKGVTWADVQRVIAVVDLMETEGLKVTAAKRRVSGKPYPDTDRTLDDLMQWHGGFVRWARATGYGLTERTLRRGLVLFHDWLEDEATGPRHPRPDPRADFAP